MRKFNLDAAREIARELQTSISISKKTLVTVFFNTRQEGEAPLGSWPCGVGVHNLSEQNYIRVVELLIEEGLMTKEKINGLLVYVATKRLVHIDVDKLFK